LSLLLQLQALFSLHFDPHTKVPGSLTSCDIKMMRFVGKTRMSGNPLFSYKGLIYSDDCVFKRHAVGPGGHRTSE
jgi:hypothetical protein